MSNVKTKRLPIILLAICMLIAIALVSTVFGGINSQIAYAGEGCDIKLNPCVGAPVTTVSELSVSDYYVVESFNSLTWKKYYGGEWIDVAAGEVFTSGDQYKAALNVTFKDDEIPNITTLALDGEKQFEKGEGPSISKTVTLTKTYTIGNELKLDLVLTNNEDNPTNKLVWKSIVVNGKTIYTYGGAGDTNLTRYCTYLTYKLKANDTIKVNLDPEKSNAVIVKDLNADIEYSKETFYTLTKDTTVCLCLDAFYVNSGYYVTINLLNAPTSDKFTITNSMNAVGDGKIEGITDEMEYRKDGETTYTSGTGEAVTDLPVGKYYVRYKGAFRWPASDEIKLEVGSAKIRVKYQEGKTFDFDIYTQPEGCLPGETVTLLFVEHDGFEFTGNPVVKIGGINYTFTRDDTYNNGTFCYCKYTCKTGALTTADALEVQELVSGYSKIGSSDTTKGDDKANSGTETVSETTEKGLPAGAIVGIVLGVILFLLIVAYVLGYFFLYRKHKLDDKAIKVIYSFLPEGKEENENSDVNND